MSSPSDVPSSTLLKKVKRYLTTTESIPRWKLLLLGIALVLIVNIVEELDIFSNSDTSVQIDQ